MQANYTQRLRLKFSKVGSTRFIGHLDLARTLERTLNRAKIPLAYTQGFNQRPRMQFIGPLPLGFTSEAELLDVWLAEDGDPKLIQQQIIEKLPPGIELYDAYLVDLKEPALQMQTRKSQYQIVLLDPHDEADLKEKVTELLQNEHIWRTRRNKKYDLRPMIYQLSLSTNPEGVIEIKCELSLTPNATGRPDELLLALNLDPLAARIHRTHITFNED